MYTMIDYFIIIFALFFIGGYLIFLYQKLEILEHISEDQSVKDSLFPQSNYIRITTKSKDFEGYIILRGYTEESLPILIARGYMGGSPCYLYMEGEDLFESVFWQEIKEDSDLETLQVSSTDIYLATYTAEEIGFFKIEESHALQALQKHIEGAEHIHQTLETEGLDTEQSYQYDFQTKQIYKVGLLQKLASLPLRWTEHLISNTLGWGFLFVQLMIIFGAMYFFEVSSSLQHQNMPWRIKELMVYVTYGITVSYFLFYYLYQKRWIRALLYAPYVAVPASLFLTAPMVLALYASAFELDKKPFHTKIVALQEYAIRFVSQSHTKHGGLYKPEYRLSHLHVYDSSRNWTYSKTLALKNPTKPYPSEREKKLFDMAHDQLITLQEEQKVTHCRGGCGFISPCNRLSLVALDGIESLGQVTLSTEHILESESLCDTLSSTTYWNLYASSIQRKEVGIMVIAKDDSHFSIGKRFAQIVGTGLAFDRKRSVLKLSTFRDAKEAQLDLRDLLPKGVHTYHQEMQALQISEQGFISTHPFYLLDKEILVDWRQIDRNKYKVIRIQQIGTSKDQNLHYYMVTGTLSIYWPRYWYYQKKDPYFDGILAGR